MKELMTKIFNVNVYGIKESLIASGYPMIATEIGEMFNPETGVQITDKDMHRGIKLGTVPSGTGHDNFLKGIVVQFDITYPVYWSPQFQRYHFADVVSSTSAMHRIHKIDLEECTNKYVSKSNNERLAKWINVYNEMIEKKVDKVKLVLDYYDDFKILDYAFGDNASMTTSCDDFISIRNKYEVYMTILSNAPQGLMKTMRVTTSYLQLKTMYAQRKNHKLKEDWGYFCDWCTTLPYFQELCIHGFATKEMMEYIDVIKNRLHNTDLLGPYDRFGDTEKGLVDYNAYLEMISQKFVNKLIGSVDIELRVLYVKDETPKMIECFQTVDKFGKTYVLVYPADIKMKKLLDLKLEIIENANTRIGVNYNFNDVYLTKEVK